MKLRLACVGLILAWTSTACQTENAYTGEKGVSDATIGAVAGAAAGAVLGNQVKGNKNTRQNARLIGAAAGAAAGAGIGNYMDKQEATLREKLKSSGVSVTRQGDQIILNMPGNVTFETGKAAINPGFNNVLVSVADVIKEYKDTNVEISGHTDNRGNQQANQILSEQRAQAVAAFMRKSGVADKRLKAVGYGPNQPVADNSTPDGQAANRRVEIFLTPQGK
ncbi:MAG: glycine zipper 2TM domain-containing protein [Proteobacteria bacterium]|nr:MAG: glycine zipper 2TM domain-containing protein [Pseudomonadota bacterium]